MDFWALKVEGRSIFGQKKSEKSDFFYFFLIESKSIENEKNTVFPND